MMYTKVIGLITMLMVSELRNTIMGMYIQVNGAKILDKALGFLNRAMVRYMRAFEIKTLQVVGDG